MQVKQIENHPMTDGFSISRAPQSYSNLARRTLFYVKLMYEENSKFTGGEIL